MCATEQLDIVHHFAAVQDPRDPRFVTPPLGDLLTIALCATLAGAKRFEDLAAFGRAKEGGCAGAVETRLHPLRSTQGRSSGRTVASSTSMIGTSSTIG